MLSCCQKLAQVPGTPDGLSCLAATDVAGSLLIKLQTANCYGLPRLCLHPQGQKKKIPEVPNAVVRNTITEPWFESESHCPSRPNNELCTY